MVALAKRSEAKVMKEASCVGTIR